MSQLRNRFLKSLFHAVTLLAVVWFAAALAGCSGIFDPGTNTNPGDDDGDDDGPTPPPPDAGETPVPPPPVEAAEYKRGSLPPLYQLTPRAEYGRMEHEGIVMQDQDFAAVGITTSTSSKLDEVAAQVNGDHPDTQVLIRAEDRQRADLIPFRGNPSDVKHFVDAAAGIDKIYVPLGGDIPAPGNEVAVVPLNNLQNVQRIRVGVRPQRVAIHPGGLIFVCNQFSNFVSVIDPRTDQIFSQGGKALEVPTEYFCSDLVFAPVTPQQPDVDEQFLFVANRFHHSVLQYKILLERDSLNNRPVGFTATLEKEILDVGMNPYRLALNEQQNALFVTSNRGGEVARISIPAKAVTQRVFMGAPATDVVNIADQLFIPTLMPDRGLLSRDEIVKPQQTLLSPVQMKGVDNQLHQVHPGAIFDGTRSYNFEDVRNGLFQVDFNLTGASTYYTDDSSGEPNFVAQQKILAGASPQAIARNKAGTRLFMPLGSSGIVQEFQVNLANRPFSVSPVNGGIFQTDGKRPFAVSVDDVNNRLYVVNWGGETLEIFDLTSRQRVGQPIDLGYAQPEYPATNIERGEFFFYDASWSNDGDKSCASCHWDELIADGVGYSNGVTTPTAYHQVKPNYNLLTTDSYFWNGAFKDGDYTSVAFAAQVRDNCELIAFSLTEGPGSNPATRVGDPNNVVTDGNDANCRPQASGADRLPANFAQIAQTIAAQKLVGKQHIQDTTGFAALDVVRFIDFYSVSEIRLPPNPTTHLDAWGELASTDSAKIDRGAQVFISAGCGACHDPNFSRAPFTDGKLHGQGSDWSSRFISRYGNGNNDVVKQFLPGGVFPQKFLDSVTSSVNDTAINIQADPLDYFIPFCFDTTNCLEFDDPLAVIGNTTEENRRLALILQINLADPERQFMPGNTRGNPAMNTPSLRGLWTQANLLHHGYAHRITEAILPPGHAALKPGELGYAVSNAGTFDNHGATSTMSVDDVDALVAYVLSIE
jgi:DNA-binding beta-propeller fold protein YncE/cytochrome c peroxidase